MAVNPELIREALAMWDDFPVDRDPRPVVLTMPSAQWEDAAAALLRRFRIFDAPAVPERELPPGQLAAARRYCRDVQTGVPGRLGRIVRAAVPFATDRGDRRLPALVMLPDNRRWPFLVLDRDFERNRTWCPPGLPGPTEAPVSRLAGDDRTLTFRFFGQPEQVADFPNAVVTETATAVHVEPVRRYLRPDGYDAPMSVEEREVVVRLAAPMGGRALINEYGSPLTVVPHSARIVTDEDRIRAMERWYETGSGNGADAPCPGG